MEETEIHVGDIGTIIRATIKDENNAIVDISDATSKSMTFKKPSGTNVVQNPSLFTDGTDGKMQYITQTGDIDEKGLWQLQARVVKDFMGIERKTIGILIDELITTSMKCWFAQEDVNHLSDDSLIARAAKKAQIFNKRRCDLIRAIDELLQQENSVSEKTY